jgi:hypothetical protein
MFVDKTSLLTLIFAFCSALNFYCFCHIRYCKSLSLSHSLTFSIFRLFFFFHRTANRIESLHLLLFAHSNVSVFYFCFFFPLTLCVMLEMFDNRLKESKFKSIKTLIKRYVYCEKNILSLSYIHITL